MKALHELDNAGKARLLYDLFPQEMPALIDSIENACSDLLNHKDHYAKTWNNGFMPFEYWFNLSRETADILKKYRHSMLRSSRLFSDQLFYTYTSLFVNDQIVKYAEQWSENEPFKLAVKMIYTSNS